MFGVTACEKNIGQIQERYSINPTSALVRLSFWRSRVLATSMLLSDWPVIEEISLVVILRRRKAQSLLSFGERSGFTAADPSG